MTFVLQPGAVLTATVAAAMAGDGEAATWLAILAPDLVDQLAVFQTDDSQGATNMRVTDIYPQTEYLKAVDLAKPVRVRIDEATVKTFTDQKTEEAQRKIVLSFERATKVFALNRTQAAAVALATGSDDIATWPGREIVLSAGIAHNGQPTISVSPVVTEAAGDDNPFT